MALLRMKWQGEEYLGFPLWRDNKGAYRVECGERELGVVFSECDAWASVKGDRVVDLANVPLKRRSAPKMVRGVSIE